MFVMGYQVVPISKKLVQKYEKIRRSGKYNMFTDGFQVIAELGCTVDEYVYILKNYSELMKHYNIERN